MILLHDPPAHLHVQACSLRYWIGGGRTTKIMLGNARKILYYSRRRTRSIFIWNWYNGYLVAVLGKNANSLFSNVGRG